MFCLYWEYLNKATVRYFFIPIACNCLCMVLVYMVIWDVHMCIVIHTVGLMIYCPHFCQVKQLNLQFNSKSQMSHGNNEMKWALHACFIATHKKGNTQFCLGTKVKMVHGSQCNINVDDQRSVATMHWTEDRGKCRTKWVANSAVTALPVELCWWPSGIQATPMQQFSGTA